MAEKGKAKRKLEAPAAAPALLCLSCKVVPKFKILRCLEGHVLCEECYSKLGRCPEPHLMKVVELEVDCPYKPAGCPDKIKMASLEEHLKTCAFKVTKSGAQSICNFLGYDCSFIMDKGNTSAAIKHFKEAHQLQFSGQIPIKIDFPDISATPTLDSRKVWPPIILNQKMDGYAIMFLIGLDSKDITCSVFYLKYEDKVLKEFHINTKPTKGRTSRPFPCGLAEFEFKLSGSSAKDWRLVLEHDILNIQNGTSFPQHKISLSKLVKSKPVFLTINYKKDYEWYPDCRRKPDVVFTLSQLLSVNESTDHSADLQPSNFELNPQPESPPSRPPKKRAKRVLPTAHYL